MDTTQKQTIESTLQDMELTVKAVFVPWSLSRNAGEKNPSLNWKVTLLCKGKEVLTEDYSAGMGHAPFYKKIKNHMRMMAWEHTEIVRECETGFPVTKAEIETSIGSAFQDRKRPILPDPQDVIYSMMMDGDVYQYTFEEWADNFGMDTDSRKAEKMYRECQDTGLKLIRVLGTDGFERLQEAYQDY